MELNVIHNTDCREGLKSLPDNCIDCVVTSPPYYGLRDYGMADQIGLEETPEEFINKLADVFDQIHRVLKPDGNLWLNIGDSYASAPKNRTVEHATKSSSLTGGHNTQISALKQPNKITSGLKQKDLIGIPWMLAFELRKRGWYLRQDIIWHKPNPMPESVTDRCTKSHEYIFLLTKSPKYYFDNEAIKVNALNPEDDIRRITKQKKTNKSSSTGMKNGIRQKNLEEKGQQNHSFHESRSEGKEWENETGKANKKSVWTVTTKPYTGAHFATFPQDLIMDCIKAGSCEYGCCSNCGSPYERITEKKYIKHENWFGDKQKVRNSRGTAGNSYNELVGTETKGWQATCDCNADIKPSVVLDPFMGAGTTAVVAAKLSRNYIGFELNPDYTEIARHRLATELGLFNPDLTQ